MTGLSESFWSSLTEETGSSMPISLEEEFLLVEKSKRKWEGLLEFIEQQPIQGTTEVCESADNRSLIRFPSQSIWDKSRVILSADESGFINASHISLPQVDRLYVLTESPLLHTMDNFWRMSWQLKINSIIMMNIFNEKTASPTNQIHAYMPIGAENGYTDVKEFDDYVIAYSSRESYPSFDVTELLITEQSTGLSRNVTHHAFHSWTMDTENQSHSSRCEDLMGFIFQLYSRGLFNKSDQSAVSSPVLVHCSDGVGRSGALILLEYCLQIIIRTQSLKGIKIPELVTELRGQRKGVISSGDQLKTVYMSLISGASKLLDPQSADNVLTAGESRDSDDESVDLEKQQVQDVESSDEDFELIAQPRYSSSDVGLESEHMSSIESSEDPRDPLLPDNTTDPMIQSDTIGMDISTDNTDSIVPPISTPSEDITPLVDTSRETNMDPNLLTDITVTPADNTEVLDEFSVEGVQEVPEVQEAVRAPPLSDKFYSIVPESESKEEIMSSDVLREGVIKRVNPPIKETPMVSSPPPATPVVPTHNLQSISIFIYLLLPLFVVVFVILVLMYLN